jgi:hypothetical protein
MFGRHPLKSAAAEVVDEQLPGLFFGDGEPRKLYALPNLGRTQNASSSHKLTDQGVATTLR